MSAPLLYLSDRRTLFMGTPLAIRRHALPASRMILCLEGELRYQPFGEGPPISCSSLLLPVGLPVTVDSSQALVADCYLDVCGFDYAVLRQQARRCEHAIYCDLRDEQPLRAMLNAARQGPLAAEELWPRLEALLNPPDLVASAVHHSDPRVEQVVARIKRTARENLSVDELAAAVGLSGSRLLSLFKQQAGIPIRRYRLWRRLHHATCLLAEGCSLTEAAMGSGFSDSSHFSRTFLDMLGFQPSALTRSHCELKILVTSAKGVENASLRRPPELAASSFKCLQEDRD